MTRRQVPLSQSHSLAVPSSAADRSMLLSIDQSRSLSGWDLRGGWKLLRVEKSELQKATRKWNGDWIELGSTSTGSYRETYTWGRDLGS